MRRIVPCVVVLLLAACAEDTTHRQGPPGGSGGAVGSGGTGGMGGMGGMGGADAGGTSGSDGGSLTITGQICILTSIDPTQPCGASPVAAGTTVSIQNTSISVLVDTTTGAFTMDAPDSTSPVVLVLSRDSSLFESAVAAVAVPSDANALRTVALTFEDDLLLLTNNIPQSSGGWAMVYATSSTGAPEPNVRVEGAPQGQDVFFDSSPGTNQMSNGVLETSTAGLALFNNVPQGTLSFQFVPPSGTPVSVHVPIVTGHVSIARVQVVP